MESHYFFGEKITLNCLEEFRHCNLWSLVRSPVVEITVYTAEEIYKV